MKLRWHFLFLIMGGLVTGVAASWLSQPLWQQEDPRLITFVNADGDRAEWHTIAWDSAANECWYETRHGRDPAVIRRMRLELPGGFKRFGSIGPLLEQSRAIVGCEYTQGEKPKTHTSESTFFIFDSTTGQLVRRAEILNWNSFGLIAGHHDKLAFFEKGHVILFDLRTRKERAIKTGGRPFLMFSSDGSLLACLSDLGGKLRLIDWQSGELRTALPESMDVGCYRFLNNDTLLAGVQVGRETKYSRWRWDGQSMKPLTPGIVLATQVFFPSVKIQGDMSITKECHVCVSDAIDWPLLISPLFKWLEAKNIPIERWVGKNGYKHWFVLDQQDRIVNQYYEQSLHKHRELYQSLTVESQYNEHGLSIFRLWNHAPRWPNALAAGMLVYLAGYVAMRCWRNNYPPLMT